MTSKHQSALKQGKIKKWQDDRGFGFIETDHGESVFFHVSEYLPPRRPSIGEEVVFSTHQDHQGRIYAKRVQELGVVQQKMAQKNAQIRRRNARRVKQADFEASQKKRLFVGLGFYAVLGLLAVRGDLSELIVAWYVVIGIITYLVYAKDKKAAQANTWRTPETTLHLLSLLGGWVGAMIAQTYLRHKSQKPDFRLTYYLTVVMNLAGLVVILAGDGFAALVILL